MDKLRPIHPEGIHIAIEIFNDRFPKKFLHQLVSGQLDMDRLDYLNRDSFFTGVSEGVVSYDRIIKTLNVADDKLVTDEKGIYSLEKFVIARRLMYWQVYLHKTVICAEKILITILKRAKKVALMGQELFATPALKKFLANTYSMADFTSQQQLIDDFALLDDYDVFTSIKVWTTHPDKVLSFLCRRLVSRRLFRIELQKDPFDKQYIDTINECTARLFDVEDDLLPYYVLSGHTENNAYDPGVGNIWIMQNNGTVSDMAEISDQLNIRVLSHPVKKYYICYPKEVWEKLNK
jgi:HD superfamily phosphohydrolase